MIKFTITARHVALIPSLTIHYRLYGSKCAAMGFKSLKWDVHIHLSGSDAKGWIVTEV